VSWPRLFASVVASAIGLAFWWALTEPLPVPPVILLGVAGAILFCAGLIAGRGGVIAAPAAFLFSLFIGSIIATQLHQAFRPQTEPVDEFNGLISLHLPEVLAPLAIAVVVGAIGGYLGERILPSREARAR
jgi:ABC-type antimicrobial peptide transport system permease subunit